MRDVLEAPASFALAFVSPDYVDHLDEFIDIVRVDGRVPEVIGCTAGGTIVNDHEQESGPGFSLFGVRADGFVPEVVTLSEAEVDAIISSGEDALRRAVPAGESYLMLANPFEFPSEDWLETWNHALPGRPVVGGMASGGMTETSVSVFRNAEVSDGAVLLGLGGGLQLVPAVSQGCRPIGEPLPVTRAEHNVVYSLGARPAYQALEAAYQGLSDDEKSSAQGNLFVGLANSEYIDEFKSGDFLIRNIIGADPNSGAVVIGGIPRIGQTIQYQFRDRRAADSDLRGALTRAWANRPNQLLGSLIFSCFGRGEKMFGQPNHDASIVQNVLGSHPSAGFFCNGEIGPVGGRNCAHAYTASIALLCCRRD